MFSHFALTEVSPTITHANTQADTGSQLVSRVMKLAIAAHADPRDEGWPTSEGSAPWVGEGHTFQARQNSQKRRHHSPCTGGAMLLPQQPHRHRGRYLPDAVRSPAG
jgi:hypothetical protein